MKKLFLSILVLGLLLSGNAYAKNTNLVCEEKESKNTTHIIYNEKLAKEELVLSLNVRLKVISQVLTHRKRGGGSSQSYEPKRSSIFFY